MVQDIGYSGEVDTYVKSSGTVRGRYGPRRSDMVRQ
jgi:hypothetical protein